MKKTGKEAICIIKVNKIKKVKENS